MHSIINMIIPIIHKPANLIGKPFQIFTLISRMRIYRYIFPIDSGNYILPRLILDAFGQFFENGLGLQEFQIFSIIFTYVT